MGLDQFQLAFDNPLQSYFPGQILSGKLIVSCSSTQKCQGIKIKLEGNAVVRWEETETTSTGSGSTRRSETKTVVYSNTENYLSFKCYAVGSSGSTTILPVGRTEYPFSFMLPQGLPSSFVSQYGNVTYQAQAIMKRSWNFDKKARAPFTVNALVDLNNQPQASLPGNLVKNKTVGLLCCVSGNIDLILRMPKTGYVPGEMVHVEAEIRNQSGKDVNSLNMSLIQVRKYHARTKSRIDTSVVVTTVRPGVKRNETDVIRGHMLQIPPLPPTGLGNCRIIDVTYKLHVEATLPGPSFNIKGDVPIVIGTIPLRINFPDLMPSAPFATWDRTFMNDGDQANASNFAPSAPNLAMQDYPELPPPSYEDAIRYDPVVPMRPRDRGDRVHEDGDQPEDGHPDFVPKYATWGFKK